MIKRKCLEILNGELNIPLAVLQNINYTKTGNIVESHKNEFRCRGYSCQSLSISLSITPAVLSMFQDCNSLMSDWTFPMLCNYFLGLEPNLTDEPFPLFLEDICICPELEFSITSATHTLQSDLNGNVMQMDISMTLSGVRCSKQSSRNKEVSYDEADKTPEVIIGCKGKEFACKDTCYITQFVLTPTTLNLELKLGDSFKETSADAWIFMPASEEDSYVNVSGYGKFYIKNASYDGDFVSYECTIFSKQDDVVITKTIMDKRLKDLIGNLSVACQYNSTIGNIDISNYTIHMNSIETLKEITDNLGLLAGFRSDGIHLFNVPDKISPDAFATLNYYIDTDVCSAPTTNITYRDSIHEYKTASSATGNAVVVNSPICTTTDRTEHLLKVYNLLENSIDLTIPLDTRIKHYSQVALIYQNITRNVIVADYSIDFLSNVMSLRCCYLER